MEGPIDVSSDEVILRRVRKGDPDCVQQLPSGGNRATSFAIQKLPDEEGPSWSRLRITSPRKLLDLVRLDDLNPEDFHVCRLHVAEVRALKLEVLAKPTNEDEGHCEVRETPQQAFSKKLWSRLAKKTRILTDAEFERLQAGDSLDE